MQDHSVEMAVWALRLHVWDYFLKPLAIDELINKLRELPESRSEGCQDQDCDYALLPSAMAESRLYQSK